MRCFLAIELPDDVKRHLARVQAALCDPPDDVETVTWVRRENWHVTLKFLGDVPDAGVAKPVAAQAIKPASKWHIPIAEGAAFRIPSA